MSGSPRRHRWVQATRPSFAFILDKVVGGPSIGCSRRRFASIARPGPPRQQVTAHGLRAPSAERGLTAERVSSRTGCGRARRGVRGGTAGDGAVPCTQVNPCKTPLCAACSKPSQGRANTAGGQGAGVGPRPARRLCRARAAHAGAPRTHCTHRTLLPRRCARRPRRCCGTCGSSWRP